MDSLPKAGGLPPERLATVRCLFSHRKPHTDGTTYDPQLVTSPSIDRSSTPTNVPADAATPESIAADEALLVVCATALTDIKVLETQMWKLWREELRMMLPEMSMSEDEEVDLEGPFIYSALSEPTLIPHPHIQTPFAAP